MKKILYTSESVTEGHPDKMADQISDAILDDIISRDKSCRVAVETLVTTGLAVVAGEVTTSCYVDIPSVVRKTIREIGYDNPNFGFDASTCGVVTSIQQQSPDIALGVNRGGAGDQGMMFGYATDETPEMMPLPIVLAHPITKRLAEVRKDGTLNYLRPDGKSQVTIEYFDGKPKRIDTIVVSAHHSRGIDMGMLKEDIYTHILLNPQIIPQELIDRETRVLVNPTGRFEVGGPNADTGLTGRKIIVDTYGGSNHGGGAFSGKDPSKVDRSAAYMARHVAKNIVAKGLAGRCGIQLAYAIGVAEPVSINVETYGTGLPELTLLEFIESNFDLTPDGIIRELDLLQPVYKKTASYGHFGRPEFSWEKVKVLA